ncbi:MAG: glycerol kinase [Gammaproteobacteria bacterium]|nr:MAG: glycerol kinase [Gammaproteobacteria bacterium]
MPGHILAIDQGTTSSRAVIFNDNAQPIAIAQKPTNLLTPKTGYVEQDAMQIWHTQLSCMQNVINQADLLATDIEGLAITNQRESIVMWDKLTHQPLAPAIIWQDRRTSNWCENIQNANQELDAFIQKTTGLRLDPYFSASKISWLLNNNAEIKALVGANRVAVGTIDSWLIYKLTGGEHVIEVTNAARTLLFDINTMQWSDELITKFDIAKSILPKVVASDAEFGKTQKGLFAKQLPIYAVLGDQQAALFGQGCHEPGMAKNTYGTGCFMLMNIGDKPTFSKHQLLTTVAWQHQKLSDYHHVSSQLSHQLGNQIGSQIGKLVKSGKRILHHPPKQTTYALEGSVFMAGAIVQWLRDNLGMFSNSEDVEVLAGEVNDTGGVVLLPAFTGLGAPYWKPNLTASISGMTRGTKKAHIARAALEAIAFQTHDVLVAMQKDSMHNLTELRVDGGAAKNDLLMQFQADILGVPVLRPSNTEVTAKGVALLAGIKSGLYDEQMIIDSWKLDKRFEPSMSQDEREYHLHKWQQVINRYI